MERLFLGGYDVAIYDKGQAGADRGKVMGADLAIICVPTPEGPHGAADVSAVEEAVAYLDAPLILIKSTVPPGTADRLAAKYGKAVHFSPEFMGEPRNFVRFWLYPDPLNPVMHDFVVVGGPKAGEVLDYFASVMSADTRFVACSATEAELMKYMSNAYFATKVTFCNEFAAIADSFGVDYKRLRELWLLDSRVEPDQTMVFADNPGFGGKCLPKDLSAIIAAYEGEPILLEAVQRANGLYRIEEWRPGRSRLYKGGLTWVPPIEEKQEAKPVLEDLSELPPPVATSEA